MESHHGVSVESYRWIAGFRKTSVMHVSRELSTYGESVVLWGDKLPVPMKESSRVDSSIVLGILHDITTYYLFYSLVEYSYINPKSLTFSYLDEKFIDTGLMKFLGLYPSATSWYLEFAFAFSTSSAPFTTNALPP
ncbi:hypothetical protein GW17_00017284 [Ensete ventricosum]|nr:hypothetical protein GW17_00017284 [Ensete ventricosum]